MRGDIKMKAPGPISEVRKMLKITTIGLSSSMLPNRLAFFILKGKWLNFMGYTNDKYKLYIQNWSEWCKWYIRIGYKIEKCKEILE